MHREKETGKKMELNREPGQAENTIERQQQVCSVIVSVDTVDPSVNPSQEFFQQ